MNFILKNMRNFRENVILENIMVSLELWRFPSEKRLLLELTSSLVKMFAEAPLFI